MPVMPCLQLNHAIVTSCLPQLEWDCLSTALIFDYIEMQEVQDGFSHLYRGLARAVRYVS